MICAIVAVDNNWAIGKNNDLLYKLSADMQQFKQLTIAGGIVAMGENTLLSFPKSKPLKNRINIVLCPEEHNYEDCICYHSFDELVEDLKVISKRFDIYIVGGAMFYKSMLPYCDRIYVTKVDATDPDATAFFPNLDNLVDFKIVMESDSIYDNGYNIKFVTYERVI